MEILKTFAFLFDEIFNEFMTKVQTLNLKNFVQMLDKICGMSNKILVKKMENFSKPEKI